MAQAGFTPISLYFSSTAAAVPTSGNLANGELALNTADMKLYAKNSAGVVTLLASNSSTGATVSSVSGTGTVNGLTLTGTVTTSGSLTLGGTLSLVSPPPIGSTTPNTGAFTTLSASGVITSTVTSGFAFSNTSGGTNAVQSRLNNTGGDLRVGIESSTGAVIQTGTSAYAAVFGNQANAPTQITTNGTVVATFNANGNLGIGVTTTTTATGYKVVEVQGSSGGIFQTSASGNVVKARFYSTPTAGFAGTNSNHPFGLLSNDTERFVIGTSGQFGIGLVSSPSYGTAGQVLTSGGSGAAPTWATAASGAQAFVAFGTTGESVFACGF